MIKQAELTAALNKPVKSAAGNAIGKWFRDLSPDVKNTLLRGSVGASLGAAATGGVAALTPHDREDRHAVRNQALLGAILGGTGAAALPLGGRLLGSGIRLQGESHKPIGARAIDTGLGAVARHPFSIALPAAAAYHAKDSLGALRYAMTHEKVPDKEKLMEIWHRGRWDEYMRHGKPGFESGAIRDMTPSPAELEHGRAKFLSNAGAVSDVKASPITRLSEAMRGPAAEEFWNTPHGRLHNFARATEKHPGPHMQPTRGRIKMIPAALLAGYIADRYLKGTY